MVRSCVPWARKTGKEEAREGTRVEEVRWGGPKEKGRERGVAGRYWGQEKMRKERDTGRRRRRQSEPNGTEQTHRLDRGLLRERTRENDESFEVLRGLKTGEEGHGGA